MYKWFSIPKLKRSSCNYHSSVFSLLHSLLFYILTQRIRWLSAKEVLVMWFYVCQQLSVLWNVNDTSFETVVRRVSAIPASMVNLSKMCHVAAKRTLVCQPGVCARCIHGMIDLTVVQKSMMGVVQRWQQIRSRMIQTSCFHVLLNVKRIVTVRQVKSVVEHVHHDACRLSFLRLSSNVNSFFISFSRLTK